MEEQKTSNRRWSEGNLHPKTVKRAAWVLGFAVLLFSALLVRIFLLQTVKYDYYRQKVLEQITTESSVNASRGNIYDANGMLLATNVTTYRVFISPSSIARAQSLHDREGSNIRLDALISENLSQILNVSYDYVLKQTTYTKYLDRTIAREVDEDTADIVRAFIDEYELEQMIYLESSYTRHYPYSSLASHVLGFTGSDGTGLYGLEFQYNKMLCGTNGRYVTARDSSGNEMPYAYKEYIPAQNGYNVNTTIDVFVQSALEEQLESAYLASGGENRAAGIVMNVKTGAVLGMAVYPNFNLNSPRDLDEQSLSILQSLGYEVGSDAYNTVKQNLQLTMWSNKAITESYIPGSTFKVMTASMALEEDVVTLGESHTCVGSFTVLGQKIHCHKVQGHGALTFAEGIQQSCNPVLMMMGLRLGADKYLEYFESFGYFEKTGIDLAGESKGVFFSKELVTDTDKWGTASLTSGSFGQTFKITPLQLVRAIASVVNGGKLMEPYIVSEVLDAQGDTVLKNEPTVVRRTVSEETSRTMCTLLESVVTEGTAKNASVAGFSIGGKTGTSEKIDVFDENGQRVQDKIVSFVGIAPMDDPEYIVLVALDTPSRSTGIYISGGVMAAPTVGAVMGDILPYLGVAPKEKMQQVAVEDLTGLTAKEAEKRLKEQNIRFRAVGTGETVTAQIPSAGSEVPGGSEILLYFGEEPPADTVRVPDFSGMNRQQAADAAAESGLYIFVSGNTSLKATVKAVSQSVAPGTEVPLGTAIKIEFIDTKAAD